MTQPSEYGHVPEWLDEILRAAGGVSPATSAQIQAATEFASCPATAGDLEPGWSRDEPDPYGPCYQRHVPGKGIIRVVKALGYQGYGWYLSTTARSCGLSWPRDGFTHPRDAMRDADQQVARMPLRMFERLTPGEAQELYRKLARAVDWGRGRGETALGEVRGELYTHMQILETDLSYHGPKPHESIRAVREASAGAALQAMAASPNRAAWIATRPRPHPPDAWLDEIRSAQLEPRMPEAAHAGPRSVTAEGALETAAGQDGSPATGLTAGQAFTGQVGARLPATRAGRPARTMTSPNTHARPRGPQ
jgi:hypothetical protein